MKTVKITMEQAKAVRAILSWYETNARMTQAAGRNIRAARELTDKLPAAAR